MFRPLPVAFTYLEGVTRAMDLAAFSAPPGKVEVIGMRMRRAYDRARAQGYATVSASEMRKLPYAWWIRGQPPLHELHPELVGRYWREALPRALQDGPRRARRWLMPLFFTYCDAFDPGNGWFLEYASRLKRMIDLTPGAPCDQLRQLHAEVGFFEPARAPSGVAASFMASADPIDRWLERNRLWAGFVDTAIGAAAFRAALAGRGDVFAIERAVERAMAWAASAAAPIESSVHRIDFAEALLTPWVRRQPPDSLKTRLTRLFMERYKDPRIAGHRAHAWKGVSQDALRVLLGWLAGDTLRGFIRILEQTADDIWRYRQRFWMAYYEAGHVDEVWLALGPDASRLVRRLRSEVLGLGAGEMEGGAARNQSVMLLRIGQLVFTEWSHNGSLRAYAETDPDAPRLYQSSYHGADLRDAESMDFHDGMNERPQLTHFNSQGGGWQRKARDFIRRHTGIHLDDEEIL
ncbi:EH signature domain-containing protein [Piscinibacterium candidicorallinum]|uniref:EH signature domain-containing protein n=2 Tax=Piscinibacterium candidicorallinum TaxID=1793872 RepID=A0ABV7H3V9_9BURK